MSDNRSDNRSVKNLKAVSGSGLDKLDASGIVYLAGQFSELANGSTEATSAIIKWCIAKKFSIGNMVSVPQWMSLAFVHAITGGQMGLSLWQSLSTEATELYFAPKTPGDVKRAIKAHLLRHPHDATRQNFLVMLRVIERSPHLELSQALERSDDLYPTPKKTVKTGKKSARKTKPVEAQPVEAQPA